MLPIQSAGGIVYQLTNDGPKYLLLKRHAMSGKIERVAPKGKVQAGETTQVAALREISEETGIPLNLMKLTQEVGKTHLRNPKKIPGHINKDITYFLVEYKGDPSSVQVADAEGYLGFYKRATINEVLELLYYSDMRELIRRAHMLITKQDRSSKVKEEFLQKL